MTYFFKAIYGDGDEAASLNLLVGPEPGLDSLAPPNPLLVFSSFITSKFGVIQFFLGIR